MRRISFIRYVLLFGMWLVLLLMPTGLTPQRALAAPPASLVLTNCTGEYFNNITLSGTPVLTRTDAAINFFWPENTSPAPGVNPNNYSVRWTCSVNVPITSNVIFTITTDDGMNVLVNDNLILWAFYDQGPTTYSATVNLAAGTHTVRVEYYNRWNAGTARVASTAIPVAGPTPTPTFVPPPPPPAPTGVWRGYYFSNVTCSGSPTHVRDDPAINFNWGETAIPAPGVPHNNFCVRWDSIQHLPTTDNYTISATSDDGIRVWVDGVLVIDGWFDHPPATFTTIRHLTAGAHYFTVEYYNRYLGAMAVVQIYRGTAPPTPPPTAEIIVDDGSPGWQAGGTQPWYRAPVGVGNHSYWAHTVAFSAGGYNWARWRPTLPAPGNYEVSAYIPAGVASTLNARYWIYHNGRYTLATRAQGLLGNQWVSLGTYYFSARADEFVSLATVTHECYLCRTIVFDAVKFTRR